MCFIPDLKALIKGWSTKKTSREQIIQYMKTQLTKSHNQK